MNVVKEESVTTRPRYYFLVLIVFMFVPSYAFGENILQENINTYYDAEKNGDWGKVYSFRTEAFKNSVNKDVFISDMQEAAEGWILLNYKVENYDKQGDSAVVRISFLEKPPTEYWVGSEMQASYVSIKANSVWIKEGDVWRCKESPSRSYLPYSK